MKSCRDSLGISFETHRRTDLAVQFLPLFQLLLDRSTVLGHHLRLWRGHLQFIVDALQFGVDLCTKQFGLRN